jgi:hypothetical protein
LSIGKPRCISGSTLGFFLKASCITRVCLNGSRFHNRFTE